MGHTLSSLHKLAFGIGGLCFAAYSFKYLQATIYQGKLADSPTVNCMHESVANVKQLQTRPDSSHLTCLR